MWAIGIVLSILIAIIGVLLRFSVNQLKGAFDQLIKRIDKISDTLDKHNHDLITVLSRNDIQSQSIDSHTEEIEKLKRDVSDINMHCATKGHRKPTK